MRLSKKVLTIYRRFNVLAANRGKKERMMQEMGTAWFFPRTRQIWAKCEKCRDWNRMDVKLRDFRPTPEKPYKMQCKCNANMIIVKAQFARKNMKRGAQAGK